MYFRMLHDATSSELTYLLADLDAREAVLIDPHGRDLPMLVALLAERELRLRWVLRTHHHDALAPTELAGLQRLGAPLVQGEGLAATSAGGLDAGPAPVFAFGHEHVQALATPGHTAHCLSFAWRDRLFCGGALAVDSCPHRQPPASASQWWDSVTRRLFALPNETLLFAGHDSAGHAVSTVLEQRRNHPFFARCSRDEFLAHPALITGGSAARETPGSHPDNFSKPSPRHPARPPEAAVGA